MSLHRAVLMGTLLLAAQGVAAQSADKQPHSWSADKEQNLRQYCRDLAKKGAMPVAQRVPYCECFVLELRKQYSEEDLGRVEGSPRNRQMLQLAIQFTGVRCEQRTKPVDTTRRYAPAIQQVFLDACKKAGTSDAGCECRLRRYQSILPEDEFFRASKKGEKKKDEQMKKQVAFFCDVLEEKP